MPDFLSDDFLLETPAARRLYHEYAADAPVVDFHNHLSPADLAGDRAFATLTALWLEGDHYKWRAMRANGVPERFVTGDADDEAKFMQWAATVPHTLRNPLYHWTHLELRRAFGLDALLSAETGPAVYAAANDLLATPDFRARRLLERAGAVLVCTTDDPADDLGHHHHLRAEASFGVQVRPTFRPDRALGIDDPDAFNAWVDALGARADVDVRTFDDLLDALARRHDAFHDAGCRLADHGLETFYADPYTDAAVARTFDAVRAGRAVDADAVQAYRSALCHRLARMNHAKGWTQQFHVGPLRDTNTRLRRLVGADAGCDSMGDGDHARPMARFLDRLDREHALARTILYNVNPRDNALFATMAGNFNDGSVPGKVQLGAAWWFLDQQDGLRAHLETVSNFGLLSRFVGMVTDSRSLLSFFSRHEYFRRVLCGLLGEDVARGALPDDLPWLGEVVRDVCARNAAAFLGFDVPAEAPAGAAHA